MNTKQLRLAKWLSVLSFVIIAPTLVMAGWVIGSSLVHSKYEAASLGVSAGLLGLILGSFLSFSSLGLITGWVWSQKYSNLRLKHWLLLVLGWMVIPAIFLFSILWLFEEVSWRAFFH